MIDGIIIAMLKKHPIQAKRVVFNSRFKMISLADADRMRFTVPMWVRVGDGGILVWRNLHHKDAEL